MNDENVNEPMNDTHEYTPEEINAASLSENALSQQAVLQQLQNRVLQLNIEARRAQVKVLELQKENAVLRRIVTDFDQQKPVAPQDVNAVAPVVEKYLQQAREMPFPEDADTVED